MTSLSSHGMPPRLSASIHSSGSGLRPRSTSHASSGSISNTQLQFPRAGTNRQPKSTKSSIQRSAYSPEEGTDTYCSFDERREALYMVHFVQELAPLIDICDPGRRFGTHVPKLALQNPLLTSAILAFASRDWLRVHAQEDVWSDKYSSQALQLLIPVLDRPVELLDETVLAAIVILRLYEETIDVDTGTHLLGSAKLLNSPSTYAGHGGLGEAASWIALRQQLYLSITYSQPVRMDLDYFKRYSFADSNPESLANQIILLCCRILKYAQDTGGHFGAADWVALRDEALLWYESVQWPFKPDASGLADQDMPNLWVPMPVHAIAYQHYYFALLLLTMYEPRNWAPGKEALLARRKVDYAMQENLVIISALAISNPEVITASLTAHHILYAYGPFIRRESHRRAILDFFQKIPKRSGWPMNNLVPKLQEDWSQDY